MRSEMRWKDPVFIVGASRSGTAMLQSILNRNHDVRLAGETHYFDDLRPRVMGKPLDSMDAAERNICANYFRSLTVRPYGKKGDPDQSWLSREDLLDGARDADGVFDAYCKHLASRENATVWGEKTPRHVFRIAEILELYPDAKIVCMVRDPRAVVASYRDWKNQGGLRRAEGDPDYLAAIRADEERARMSYHIVLASMMWRGAANAGFEAQMRFTPDRARLVRYEDVTDDPEATVRSVTDWLGVDFDPAMLDIPLHNSSTIQFAEQAGVSSAPRDRWREVLSDREIGVVQKVAGATLRNAGYEPIEVRTGPLDLPRAYADLPVAAVRAAMANRSRYDSLPGYVMRRLKAIMRP
jgi:hypothetical protein